MAIFQDDQGQHVAESLYSGFYWS